MFRMEDIGRICYLANKMYCESIGDKSQTSWALCGPEIQKSVVNGVKYRLVNPLATPEGTHENWYKYKKDHGWVYGEVKDGERKTHPCMLPYDELPIDQKIKDDIYVSVCDAMIPFLEK